MIVGVKKNEAYTFGMVLIDSADNLSIKTNPTLATGDYKISKDGGAFANLATLPTVSPAAGNQVEVVLSATEMDADNIMIQAIDVAGAEWNDNFFSITTQANSNADIKTDTVSIETKVDTIAADVVNIDGDAMRGTNSAALATALVTHDGKLDTVDTNVDTLNTDVTELLGLQLKNIFIDNTVYDGNGNLTSARFRVYDTKTNATAHGATGLLVTYTSTGTFTGDNMDDFLNVREP